MTQKILTLTTLDSSLRSEVVGWGYQDSSLVHHEPGRHNYQQRSIGAIREWVPGFSANGGYPHYEAVLYALADGWILMAPPTKSEDNTCEWWLSRL